MTGKSTTRVQQRRQARRAIKDTDLKAIGSGKIKDVYRSHGSRALLKAGATVGTGWAYTIRWKNRDGADRQQSAAISVLTILARHIAAEVEEIIVNGGRDIRIDYALEGSE
jgi:hypothetical protein